MLNLRFLWRCLYFLYTWDKKVRLHIFVRYQKFDNVMKLFTRKIIIAIIIVSAIIIGGLALYYLSKPTPLKISTTTSLYGTGLLDYLKEVFEGNNSGVDLQFIAVGSGAALEYARRGDVDMVLVHAPNLEYNYIEDGVIINGSIFAYNYFVIVGPKDDPAGIKDLDPIEAMKHIYNACEEGKAIFVSRGDNSGTHQRELLLWKLANLTPFNKSWYHETGTGMTDTLLYANQKNAYTISDTGTYLKLKKEERIDLEALVSEGRVLINIYSVYLVNNSMYPHTNLEWAKKFMLFLLSDEGQELIGSYGVEEFGEPLFYPAKGKENQLRADWEWFVELSQSG